MLCTLAGGRLWIELDSTPRAAPLPAGAEASILRRLAGRFILLQTGYDVSSTVRPDIVCRNTDCNPASTSKPPCSRPGSHALCRDPASPCTAEQTPDITMYCRTETWHCPVPQNRDLASPYDAEHPALPQQHDIRALPSNALRPEARPISYLQLRRTRRSRLASAHINIEKHKTGEQRIDILYT